MTVTTQFANADDFLERAEAELGLDDDASIDGNNTHPSTSIELTDGVKASLAASLLKKDNNLASNSHARAKSRRSTFSCSTGNDTNRSMNTAKYAIKHKSRALELASKRKKLADLEATHRAMAQRIRELEESFANTFPTPGTANKAPRYSVMIFEPAHTTTRTPGGSDIGEVVNVDKDGSSSDESEDAEWNDDDGNNDTSTVGKTTLAPTPKYPSRTSRSAAGANAARSLDGVG
jgi:hypothetical protein